MESDNVKATEKSLGEIGFKQTLIVLNFCYMSLNFSSQGKIRKSLFYALGGGGGTILFYALLKS